MHLHRLATSPAASCSRADPSRPLFLIPVLRHCSTRLAASGAACWPHGSGVAAEGPHASGLACWVHSAATMAMKAALQLLRDEGGRRWRAVSRAVRMDLAARVDGLPSTAAWMYAKS
jgi:hypothetical protein